MSRGSAPWFDWRAYGSTVRHARKAAGCRTAAEFSAMIYRRTRLEVSMDALYRIEQGRQQPTPEQFMAINLALFGRLFIPIEEVIGWRTRSPS